MARSDIFSLIPLDFWAMVYGVDLYRFNQVAMTDEYPDCDPLWCQTYADSTVQGTNARFHLRDALARAMREAEMMMEETLLSPVAPDWLQDEILWVGDTGLVQTNRVRVLRFGQPQWTLVGTYVPGYAGDVGQVTVPVADFTGDMCDLWVIATGYPSSDPGILKTYSIRPVRWHRTAVGNSIARGHKAQFVDPSLWETCVALVDEAATYLTSVEVWQETIGVGDTYPAAEIILLSTSCGTFCAEDEEVSCAAVRGVFDQRGGRANANVWPASFDDTTQTWSAICFPCGFLPQRVRLYYEAGIRPRIDPWCEGFDRRVAEAVARLATARLSHEPCGCDAVAQQFTRDRAILGSEDAPADPYAFVNPFGNTWAAQNAYKVVKSIRPNNIRGGGQA